VVTTEAELLAQIYADPAADAPRLVYADYLQERDDPRGELIAMQILRRDPVRERELVAAHGAAWLGELAAVVDLRPEATTAFERGFLSIAELRRDVEPELRRVMHAPQWRTVEEVRGWDTWLVLGEAPLPALRRFGSMVEVDRLAGLAQRPTPLASLHEADVVAYAKYNDEQRALLARCDGMPALRELAIVTNWTLTIDDVLWLLDTDVAARLQRLVIRRPLRPRMFDREEHAEIQRMVDVLVRTRATVPALRLTTPGSPIELARGPSGTFAR
jgi:uncharacterized protein (TIGR02996 family)